MYKSPNGLALPNMCYHDSHDDVIRWKHFQRYWNFVRGIHRSLVNSTHKGQWHGALMFSLICAWINGWVNNGEAGDLRRHHAHYDVTLMALKWLDLIIEHQNSCPSNDHQDDSRYISTWYKIHYTLHLCHSGIITCQITHNSTVCSKID